MTEDAVNLPTEALLRDYLAAAGEAARRGAEVLQGWRRRFEVREKGRFNYVTDADLASQRTIREFLLQRFPNHGFLGEEDQVPHRRPPPDAQPTWIVDPLDGTTNYIHDCPFYCVSIGLQVAGRMIVGVVYDPARDELFAAAKGLGAWLGERRLQCNQAAQLEDAMLSITSPTDLVRHEVVLDWWRYFSLRACALRDIGSTALSLAYVAAGRFDAYWAPFENYVWDVAAGLVLVQEAGGIVTHGDGRSFDPHTPDVLASNGALHPILLDCLRTGP